MSATCTESQQERERREVCLLAVICVCLAFFGRMRMEVDVWTQNSLCMASACHGCCCCCWDAFGSFVHRVVSSSTLPGQSLSHALAGHTHNHKTVKRAKRRGKINMEEQTDEPEGAGLVEDGGVAEGVLVDLLDHAEATPAELDDGPEDVDGKCREPRARSPRGLELLHALDVRLDRAERARASDACAAVHNHRPCSAACLCALLRNAVDDRAHRQRARWGAVVRPPGVLVLHHVALASGHLFHPSSCKHK